MSGVFGEGRGLMLVNRCDRCGKSQVDTTANRHCPPGWETVLGTELCDDCARMLHSWLSKTGELYWLPEEFGWDFKTRSLVVRGRRISFEKLVEIAKEINGKTEAGRVARD